MEITINSQHIFLRNFEDEDIEAVFSYRSSEDVARFQYWEPYTLEQTKEFIHRNKDINLSANGEWNGLAIVRKDDNKLIGDCAFKITGHTAELGCNVSPLYQGKGYAKETLTALINYCSENMGVTEFYGITDSLNTASIKLLEVVGMSKVADFEERIMCKGLESIEHKYVRKIR
ncbi:MAG: GNAT family N-acetyltransferase [Dysgonomonas sp.]|nr:GNAT family N-acetyltransferase [Dysgonomonas sp.]